MTIDMTQGSTGKILWKFSIPMLISVMFQQIYNIADSMIAGKFIGEDALAAVGASYPITMIFMAVAVGSNIGCSVIISQLFGGKKFTELKTAVTTTFISAFVLSIILTLGGFLLCTPLMELIKTPENIFTDAQIYLDIYIAGLIFLFLYNVCTGIFTALGDSRTPLYFLIGSSVGNIILDIVFVTTFSMGVAGVAWATFIAQGIACILSILTLMKRMKAIKSERKSELFSWNMLGKIAIVAVPSILQQSFISVGNLMVQGLVNGFGSSVVAGYSAAIKLNTFAISSFSAITNSVSSFTAQNIGAGYYSRIKEGFKCGMVMAICVGAIFFGLYFFFDEQMVNLFLDADSTQEALNAGREFLKIVSPFYFAISIKFIADAILRGAGKMTYFMICTFSDLIIRVGLSWILSSYMQSSTGIWLSWPIGWTIGMVLSWIFYNVVQKEYEKKSI